MDLQQSIANQRDFSLSLAKHVITTYAKDKNIVFSPLSIHIAMSMVAAGSDGPTQDQLLGFLKSDSIEELNFLSSEIMTGVFTKGKESSTPPPFFDAECSTTARPRLSLANGVWVNQSLRLKPAFQEIVQSVYRGFSNHVDFENKADEVREEVNAWAEKKTKGLIKELLPPNSVSADTMLILANALYFKGTWAEQFVEDVTKDCEFFLLSGTSIQVPFMFRVDCYQSVRVFDGFKVLSLPYEQGFEYNRRFSMYLFLPESKDGLPDLLEKFGSESGFIEDHIPPHSVRVGRFRIPKFKIGFGFEASKVVKELGVVHPFCGGGVREMAESSSSGRGEALFVSKILHKSFIEVNEQGTEAAAVTEVEMDMGCCMEMEKEERVDFVADHPFLFAVREDISGAVLFVGQLLNPLAE